ncbi:MAG: hypothetical protein ACFCD0_23125 [Gemmataceae bacterium]
MKMGPVSIGFGLALVALGIAGYGYALTTPKASLTALIPSALGVVLIGMGILALKENLRMHAMHVAVLVGLIGFLGSGYRITKTMVTPTTTEKSEEKTSEGKTSERKTSEEKEAKAEGTGLPVALIANIANLVLCGGFVGLCVKSFIDARKARKQEEAAATQGAPQA